MEPATVTGWCGEIAVERIAGRKVTLVPILRAGLGMLDGALDMIPNAKVSVVGVARNHETLQPEQYFERFVGHLEERTALIIDPMLATAGSMIATVDLLKARGVDAIISFRAMLLDILDKIEVNQNYTKSDTLQVMRILKNYDLLKDTQLDMFPDRAGAARRAKA